MPQVVITRLGLSANNTIVLEGQKIEYLSDITPNYNEVVTYGRNEPILTYKNTTRSIKFTFEVVSQTLGQNQVMNELTRLLYPIYDTNNVVIGNPLFRIKYGNLICDAFEPDKGVVCGLKGVVIGPSFSYGRIAGTVGPAGTVAGGVGELGAGLGQLGQDVNFKTFKVAMTIIPLHASPLGYDSGGTWKGGDKFPFGGS